MTVVAPETLARQALKGIIEAEFAADNFQVLDDKLDASLGSGGPRIGTSPVTSRTSAKNANIMAMQIFVQFYMKWKKQINPEQRVDPSVIELIAERFRRALYASRNVGTSDAVWYFDLSEINFVDDPTGNKTRFEAYVVATGNNSAQMPST